MSLNPYKLSHIADIRKCDSWNMAGRRLKSGQLGVDTLSINILCKDESQRKGHVSVPVEYKIINHTPFDSCTHRFYQRPIMQRARPFLVIRHSVLDI